MRQVSEDLKRALDFAPPLCVAAAYELETVGGEGKYAVLEGRHVGIFDDEAAAQRWLATGEPKPTQIIVKHSGAGDAPNSRQEGTG